MDQTMGLAFQNYKAGKYIITIMKNRTCPMMLERYRQNAEVAQRELSGHPNWKKGKVPWKRLMQLSG